VGARTVAPTRSLTRQADSATVMEDRSKDVALRCEAVRCVAVRHGAKCCGAERCAALRHGAKCCGAERCAALRHGAQWCGVERCAANLARGEAQRFLCSDQVSTLMTIRAPIVPVFDVSGKRLVGHACNWGPKGWLPANADGDAIAGPLPTLDACARVLRELALHGVADGD
jgi:hypothetical protein